MKIDKNDVQDVRFTLWEMGFKDKKIDHGFQFSYNGIIINSYDNGIIDFQGRKQNEITEEIIEFWIKDKKFNKEKEREGIAGCIINEDLAILNEEMSIKITNSKGLINCTTVPKKGVYITYSDEKIFEMMTIFQQFLHKKHPCPKCEGHGTTGTVGDGYDYPERWCEKCDGTGIYLPKDENIQEN